MANYTLRQLKYFVTTVKCGTVAEASRQLYIAQPSISAAIKGLEESFNVQLLIRQHAQGMFLTQAGQRFYEKAQELLHSAHAFEQNAMADNEMVNGQIDIGCFETVAPLYLPMLLASFKERFPGVRIRIHDGEQHELVHGLTNGRFDLAILFRHDLDSTLEVEPLMKPSQPYVLLPEGHPLCEQAVISLHDLVNEPMIHLDVLPSRTYFISVFEEHGLSPNVVFSSLDHFFGGMGKGVSNLPPGRLFTMTETRIINILLTVFFRSLKEAWAPLCPLEFETVSTEINPNFAQIADQNDLRRVVERKMRERQEFLDRYFVFAPNKEYKATIDYSRTRGLLEEIRTLAASRGLGDVIEFTGELRGAALIDRIDGCDVCLVPDPETGEPPEDLLVGFLPPNVAPPEGEVNVVFSVRPRPGLPTGTELHCWPSRLSKTAVPPICTA